MKFLVRNGQNGMKREADVVDSVTLLELAEGLVEKGFLAISKDGAGYNFINTRTNEELPGEVPNCQLDLLPDDVVSIYPGTKVA